MKWFLGAYTIRLNTRRHLSGHVFAGRYKSLIIDDEDPVYLRAVCDYIHLNPSRAGLLKEDETLAAYVWSSFPSYLRKPGERGKWLRTDRVFGEHGIRHDNRQGRLAFARRMEAARREENKEADYQEIRRGWRFGAEDFVARMLDRIVGACGSNHTWREQAESMEQRAKRIVQEGLLEAGWDADHLRDEAKGHPMKVKLARRLRRETTMTLQWIAERLCMGSWTYVSNLLRPKAPSPKCVKDKD